MNWFQRRLYSKTFASSPANYQKEYDSLFDKDWARPPKRVIRGSKSVLVKSFNINVEDGNIISVAYFDNYKRSSNENSPVIIYFYGNSFSNRNPIHYINYCSFLSYDTNSIVIMVNCLQPPRFRFPMAHDNAVKAIRWVRDMCPYWQISSDKTYVSGDLLGANLALSAVLDLRNETKGFSIAGMILTDPIIDTALSSPSFFEFAGTPVITRGDLRLAIKQYIRYESQIFDRRFCIAKRKDFTKLPPTLIVTSQWSPARDDAFLLEKKIRECGGEVFLYDQKEAFCSFLFTRSASFRKDADRIVREFVKKSDINFLRTISSSQKAP